MAKKSRYMGYAKGLYSIEKKNLSRKKKSVEKTTEKTILQKLNELKGQEFQITIPIGDVDEK